jgi:hypothetical protein
VLWKGRQEISPETRNTIEMMTPNILRKLTAELAQPIMSERQVVYILCLVRKIVDRDSNKQRWNSLKLYCNWAMHTDLTYESIRPFIQQIGDFFLATFSPDGTGVSQAQHEVIQKLVYLDGFREDMHTFFVEHNLPHALTDDGEKWNDFIRHYGGVIHDGSLVYSGKCLQLIKRMTFTTLPSSSEAVPFNIKWELLFNDGRGVSLMLHPNWKLVGSRLEVTYPARGGEPGTPPSL